VDASTSPLAARASAPASPVDSPCTAFSGCTAAGVGAGVRLGCTPLPPVKDAVCDEPGAGKARDGGSTFVRTPMWSNAFTNATSNSSRGVITLEFWDCAHQARPSTHDPHTCEDDVHCASHARQALAREESTAEQSAGSTQNSCVWLSSSSCNWRALLPLARDQWWGLCTDIRPHVPPLGGGGGLLAVAFARTGGGEGFVFIGPGTYRSHAHPNTRSGSVP
jgi:hypothetical protein